VFDKFMVKLLAQPEVKPLLSDEHFSVDGTLIEAWASHKSFKPKDADKDDDGESVSLTVCERSMAGCDQRIVVGKRSAKKMTNWA
jgi:hypothetical protein